MGQISVQKLNWRQWAEFAPTWERLHSLCPNASYFVSRSWVDCWLATFGEDLNPDLLSFRNGSEVVGCCLLVWRTQWIRGFPLRRVFLNCAGENDADSTCIEYNSLLSLPEYAEDVAGALVRFLQDNRWDELVLSGMADSVVPAMASSLGDAEVSDRLANYVDLQKLRSDGVDFDSTLSAKTRKNARRSHRAYDGGGSYSVRFAESSEEAIAMLRELANLHQISWVDRGRPGVFASQKFTAFHETLVRKNFDKRQILICQVRNGADTTVGMLYCFLDRGCVRFYQSGFNYGLEGNESPGLLTLYLAIRHCLEQTDYLAFDFLAGDSQYKRSLATTSRPMSWIIVRRKTLATVLFRSLRWIKRKYAQNRNASKSRPVQPSEQAPNVPTASVEPESVGAKPGK